MSEQEGGENPNKFGIIEVPKDNPAGLSPGDYLVTDIPISDWVKEESNLNSTPRLKLAFWAQQISKTIGEPFSLTCKAQSEVGFAIFKIDSGMVESRDLYWFDPTRNELPQTDARPSTILHFTELIEKSNQ